MAALRLQSVFPFGEWSGIGAIPVVRDCSGFATLQWLIERSWSCRHSVYIFLCYSPQSLVISQYWHTIQALFKSQL